MEEGSEESVVEEREELMVSPTGGNPTRRQAFFLKPSVHGTVKDSLCPSLSFPFPTFDPQNWPLKLIFKGWRNPRGNMAKWVDLLLPQYQSLWKQAGIYDAIMSSTHEIRRDDDLVCGIVERWCPDTKSFVFVWGEATITLEDVMVLGGFSVVGKPVSLPLETTELKELEERLHVARKEVVKSKANKASQHCWVKKFMGSGSDIEHEAFLVLWLCRFIFLNPGELIKSNIFPIAIHLARGKHIALAPAVLAAIYRDLTVLKQTIVDSVKFFDDDDDPLSLTLCSPFHLLQLWLWERFPEFQPVPNSLKEGDTRSARWHKVNRVRVENARSVLDSASENFIWHPYTNVLRNWEFSKFYKEHEGWVHVDSGLYEEVLPFTRCIRVSQLVGLGFIEQYLPHRVAMQFGMDQDLPGDIPQPDETLRIAWSNYCKPIGTKLYIPPRLFESDVTIRYLEWWNQYVLGQVDATEGVLQQPRSSKRLKKTIQDSEEKGRNIDAEIWTDSPKASKTLNTVAINANAGEDSTSLNVQLLPHDGAMAYVKKPRSKRRVRSSKQHGEMASSFKKYESPLLQVLRSINKEGNGGHSLASDEKPFLCSEFKRHSTSTPSHEMLRYKKASNQVMKGPNGGVNTMSTKSHIREDDRNRTMKKPKLEPEDEIGEIDKVIVQLKAEFANRLDKQFKIPSTIIAELKQEFGMGI